MIVWSDNLMWAYEHVWYCIDWDSIRCTCKPTQPPVEPEQVLVYFVVRDCIWCVPSRFTWGVEPNKWLMLDLWPDIYHGQDLTNIKVLHSDNSTESIQSFPLIVTQGRLWGDGTLRVFVYAELQ